MFADKPSARGRGRRSESASGLIEQTPYNAPDGWSWIHMGELGETNIGLTYSPDQLNESGIPVLRSNNVQAGKIELTDLVRVASQPKASVMAREGDMLICARNGSRALVGKAAIIENLPEPMAFGAFMAIFRSPLNRYLHLFLSSPVFRQVIDEVNTNTINQITQANLRTTLVPLPPLAEQLRIVAKVDVLDHALRPAGGFPRRHLRRPPPSARRAARRSSRSDRGSRTGGGGLTETNYLQVSISRSSRSTKLPSSRKPMSSMSIDVVSRPACRAVSSR